MEMGWGDGKGEETVSRGTVCATIQRRRSAWFDMFSI